MGGLREIEAFSNSRLIGRLFYSNSQGIHTTGYRFEEFEQVSSSNEN